MKLILANNQNEKFKDFCRSLNLESNEPIDYSSYEHLLFVFDNDAAQQVLVKDTSTGKYLHEYNGVYINGYLNTYELAATVATCCDYLHVPYVNKELRNAPSLSKLTAYAKLVAANVQIPMTIAGTKKALVSSKNDYDIHFPAVLKRADADRGIDNFKIASKKEFTEILQPYDGRSLWILQEYIDNKGFYLVSFYDEQPAFCIFRSLEARPDANEQKAHMYKPKGGANATLIALDDVPIGILEECTKAIKAMNRQIGSVDCIFTPSSNKTFVLEVNYNPQLVTIETFKDVRIKAYLKKLNSQWKL